MLQEDEKADITNRRNTASSRAKVSNHRRRKERNKEKTTFSCGMQLKLNEGNTMMIKRNTNISLFHLNLAFKGDKKTKKLKEKLNSFL